MGSTRLAGICAASVLVVLTAGHSARADTLLLENGDHVRGDVQLADLAVTTPDGVVRVSPEEIWQVSLGRIHGDVVTLHNAGELTGHIEEATYSIRLRSGQTLVFGRNDLARIVFHRR